jgi:N6-adenosine-specific RNA methylase IME4
MKDYFSKLQQNHYKVVYADPPWTFVVRSPKGETKSPQSHYQCMTIDAIKALPVAQLAHPEGSVCVMWTTAPMIQEGLDTLKAWGWTYKSMAAWAKRSSTGTKWAFGTGYIFRSAAEFILVGTRGKIQQKARNVRNLLVSPVREHSRKPDLIYDLVESLWDGPYVELFSRTHRQGWDSFGDQIGKFEETVSDNIFSFASDAK